MLTIDWQRSMVFDGLKARFEHAVVASMGQRQMRTETMEVQFLRPIRFSEPGGQDQNQPEEIRCLDGVWLENRTFDQQRQLTSHDQIQLSDLNLNVISVHYRAGQAGSIAYAAARTTCSAGRWLPWRAAGPPARPPSPKTRSIACTCSSRRESKATFWSTN